MGEGIAKHANEKQGKYAELLIGHHFIPITIETSEVFGPEAAAFFRDLGHRPRSQTGDPLSYS